MTKYEITAELNLKNLILELREVSQALNECADKLLMIEIKYDKEQKMKNDDWASKWATLFVILMSENYKLTKNERHNLAMLLSDKKRKESEKTIMTNAEKFKEVFGFDLNPDLCLAPTHFHCEDTPTCYGCKWNTWQDQKYEEPKDDGNSD